jgi:Restriction endonuclease S subunits
MTMNSEASKKVDEVIHLPSKLPSGWEKSSLAEVAEVIMGQSPSSEYYNVEGNGLPFFQGKAEFGDLYPEAVKWCSAPGKIAQKDDVLISVRAPVGPTNLAPSECCIGRGLAAIRPRNGIPAKYILHYLRSIERDIDALGTGTTFKAISGKTLRDIPVPIAPLDQQKRIVAEIEKQFSRLDEAVANLKRVKANLKRYKASVLKAAVEGRLVETEAELARKKPPLPPGEGGGEGTSYETGAQLLQRILETRRSQWKGKGKYKEPAAPDTIDLPELPEGWVWANWEQVGFSQNGRPFPSSDYCDKGVRLLRPGNLHESGALVWTAENTRHMPPQYAGKNPDLIVKGGELVMNLTAQSLKDEFLGRVCFTADGEHCLLNQRLARLIPIELLPEFVLIVFKSRWFRRFVDGLNTGSLIQHMFTSQLATFAFPIPPIAEQHRIVSEVDCRLSLVREVETQADANLQRTDRLHQSILSRAFSGKLINEVGISFSVTRGAR